MDVRGFAPRDDETSEPPLKKGPGVQFQVPVHNFFDVLMESSRKSSVNPPSKVYEETVSAKKKRPPPITIPLGATKSLSEPVDVKLRTIIESACKEYSLKWTSSGLKVYTTDSKAHNAVSAALAHNKIGYWTHPAQEQKTKRFVLYGLDKRPLESISSDLIEENINPTKINYMICKSPRYSGECNYILYFPWTSDITLSQLRDCKAINHTIVQWAHYKPKESGVGCCRNCCNFGHGGTGCGLPSKCIICADNHHYSTCHLLIKKREGGHESIHPKHLKCANCQGNHTATFKECPKRLEYIGSYNSKRVNKTNNQQQRRPAPAPALNETNYPAPAFMHEKYQTTIHNPAPVRSEAQTTEPIQQQPNRDMYSIAECQSMMNELYNSLQSCTSRFQQAKVIADYSFKYFCKFP